jgi:hypothetical protein
MKSITALTYRARPSTLLRFLACGALLFVTADLQAQLLYKTKFSAAEGYTNGWAIGQPSSGPLAARPWMNMNDDPGVDGALLSSCNTGISYTNDDGSPWLVTTVSNVTAASGGQMWIHGDGGWGTNNTTYFWGTLIGARSNGGGGITITFDWQYFGTNLYGNVYGSNVALVYPSPLIPADYDPTNNNYNNVITNGATKWNDWDQGVCLSDISNRWLSCGAPPNWRYCGNCTPVRIAGIQDCRDNDPKYGGPCGNHGNWDTPSDRGPQFKDGKLLHVKYTAYAGLPVDDPTFPTNNCFEAWSWRDGEGVYQTATAVPYIDDGGYSWPSFGDRSCPGEYDPTSGINMINIWYNPDKNTRIGPYSVISNIRVVGPNAVARPTLSIAKVGGNVQVTFTGWLEAADNPQGPYTTVAVQPYPYTTPTIYNPPAEPKKFYRASM